MTTPYKMKRKEGKNKKIREGKKKLMKDKRKGLTYKSGMSGPGGSMDDLEAPAMKKKKVVCETCSLVGHVTRKSQKCKYSTNEKSNFYGNPPPAVETVESTINNEHNNEPHGEFVKIGTQDRFERHASV